MRVISHDRSLLTNVCNRIWEIEDRQLFKYKGNWDVYKVEHHKLLLNRISQFQKNRKEKERLEDLLFRIKIGKANITKSKSKDLHSVRSRIARVESRMPDAQPGSGRKAVQAKISYDGQYSDFMLRVEDFTLMINGETKVENLNFHIEYGQKIAISAANGAGKSTFLKLVLHKAGLIPEITYADYTGEMKISPSAQIGYFDQDLQLSDTNLSIGDYIRKKYNPPENHVYGLLRKYLFEKSQISTFVADLSGGEKNRLQLMDLIEGNYNFLILDEPTNHLDLHAVQALEEMLREYNGSILFVSHDAHFVDAVADEVVQLQELQHFAIMQYIN